MGVIKENLFTVEYNNKKYLKGNWDALICSLIFKDNYIRMKYFHDKLDINYLYKRYLGCLRKYSFLGLVLPAISFLLLSLVISLYVILNEGELFFLLFLSMFFSMLFCGLAYKILVKKQKCLYIKSGKRYRYQHINPSEYETNLQIFRKVMKKEFYYFKPLESERLIIRELKAFDEDDLFTLLSSDEVNRYLSTEPIKKKTKIRKLIKTSQDDYKKENIFRLGIELKAEAKVIGYIGLSRHDLTVDTCQIVYALNNNYWSKGYATEAVKTFIPYLQTVGKKLIIAGHVKENSGSGNVLIKAGFKRKAAMDHKMNIHGEEKYIKIYVIEERNNV